ncbi:cell division protein FtsX [Capnocytophaga catalasegens]|uniref:Cell division protein FtsX n=1 Tax=Capnocytophaga catalasegens TaxID=1004260 RepID=A0AAV5ANZ1_9FLAO|nr:permease-like cell division protein FtsX [Capnocytophaga catalasegens]GIZ14065.1 cell division protein FtsX [Capnocytophaga catalasegens]GJM49063.1 cell division protein FtsX [Capnocytophaga catalasegens]GJM52324.1 cell division protein FtsX [Capnocytophaga catalasegens]
MNNPLEQYNRRKLISSYFSVTLSITLVLFLLGALGFLVLNTQNITNSFKEQMLITIFLKNEAKDADIEQLQKTLSVAEYSKSVHFISKEKAAEVYSEELGEDFVSFIGDNPLRNSFDLHLKADYVNPQQIVEIAENITQNPSVSEVSYDKPMIAKIHDNISKISVIILSISGIFTLVAILLINSSIRLSVYSKRFIIKTMQLVGATKNFIRKPFILTNIMLGIIGAILACGALFVCLYYVNLYLPDLQLFSNTQNFSIVFGGLFLLGIFISWFSTFFAAQRFLNLHTDDLYI